ncbi:hypothetical protein [Rheinheimera sp. 1928-s]|uniref:hypothetical protein n=1 Tax=Rheinheimera sp. 1928-s TaxID=3033803 RepID=UPI00262ED175|nr:hypothetical protein [Rheinheimera sp. 1928-s]MDF3123694.1 hypothetical protein [Rheinheimera sp. 1928-s]
MNFATFLPDILAGLISGAGLTYAFFLLREKVFKPLDIDGSWTYDQTTMSTEFKPYEGMVLRYLVLVARTGNTIYGSAEKIYEKNQNEEKPYNGKQRTQVKITGHIERNYLGQDKICIHIEEVGKLRNSTTIHILSQEKDGSLTGRFASTISNQIGQVTWKKRSS